MNRVNKIVIVGGGSSGWISAATLIKAFPDKNIQVIESPDVPIIGVGESTLGGLRHWTRYIGLDEHSFFPYTDASYKLSIKFTDFYKKDGGSFHYPFGRAITQGERNPYYDWHLKKYYFPNTPVQDFVNDLFPSSALINSNKFSENRLGEFDNFIPEDWVAYHFDATKFGSWLRDEYCIPKEVVHISSTVKKINTDVDGIKNLELSNGEIITADLFIDCTGFNSLLLGDALEETFESLSDMLPNNRAWATRLEYKEKEKELEGFTNCTAIENGWCWNIPLWSRIGTGYVYSDKFVSSEDALEEFKKYLMSEKMLIPRTREEVDSLEYKDIKMRVGIHRKTFVKNVVAIGLSAGFIEPLESNGLFSAHEFIFKLVDILQRGEISQFDRDMYNASTKDLFINFSKFVALHYALSHRDDTEYWRSIKNKTFEDRYGDQSLPYITRVDSFHNMTKRFMETWSHPYDEAGIPFISTGMNISMINSRRIDSMKFRNNIDFYSEIISITNSWEIRKARWKKNAELEPTLFQYLKEKFYKNQ